MTRSGPPRSSRTREAARYFKPTFDTFGGGGLVSTTADLTRFIRGTLEGRLFRRPGTLAQMLWPTAQSAAEAYGLGIRRTEIDGEPVWGHTGFFGAIQMYAPGRRLSVVATVNQAEADRRDLARRAFRIAVGQSHRCNEHR